MLDEEVDLGPVKLISQGDQENARKYFRLALEADPLNVKALFGLSRLLRDSDPERKALLSRLLSKQHNLLAYLDLGDYLRTYEKDFDAAHLKYKQAVDNFPREKSAYLKLQDLCRRMDRRDEAAEWSRRWKEQVARFHPKRSKREKEITVQIGVDGWAVCPQCGFRFKPEDPNVIREGRHRRCGQRIRFSSD